MRRIFILPLCALAVAACSDATSPTQGTPRTLTMTFGTGSPDGASAQRVAPGSAALASVTATDPTNTVVITRAQLVLSELRLKKVETAECPEDDGLRDDDCERIESGPLLIDLPLDAGAGPTVSLTVPEDTYRELEMRVEAVESDDDGGAEFLAANPAFENLSVRAEGTFNGEPFVFTSPLESRLEIEFASPLVVDQSALNVTVNVDVSGWFRTPAGAVIDPRTATADDETTALVDDNIRASFDAFRDDNRDGHDDGQGGADDGPDHQ